MEKRNILDYQGNVVGELELPEGTSEQEWQKKLAVYAVAPNNTYIAPITSRQIRLQIVLQGLSLSDITDAIAQLPEPDRSLAAIEWEYATVCERQHTMVDSVGAILGLNSAQLDELWIAAAKL